MAPSSAPYCITTQYRPARGVIMLVPTTGFQVCGEGAPYASAGGAHAPIRATIEHDISSLMLDLPCVEAVTNTGGSYLTMTKPSRSKRSSVPRIIFCPSPLLLSCVLSSPRTSSEATA